MFCVFYLSFRRDARETAEAQNLTKPSAAWPGHIVSFRCCYGYIYILILWNMFFIVLTLFWMGWFVQKSGHFAHNHRNRIEMQQFSTQDKWTSVTMQVNQTFENLLRSPSKTVLILFSCLALNETTWCTLSLCYYLHFFYFLYLYAEYTITPSFNAIVKNSSFYSCSIWNRTIPCRYETIIENYR